MFLAVKIAGKVPVWVVSTVLAHVMFIVDVLADFHHILDFHPWGGFHRVAFGIKEMLRDVSVSGDLPPDCVESDMIQISKRCKIMFLFYFFFHPSQTQNRFVKYERSFCVLLNIA